MISAGAVNKKQTLRLFIKTIAINPTGNFLGIDAKIFQQPYFSSCKLRIIK
jgi:hypothetical protein